jgi:hypothetical protein
MTPQAPKEAPGWSQATSLQTAPDRPHRAGQRSLLGPGFVTLEGRGPRGTGASRWGRAATALRPPLRGAGDDPFCPLETSIDVVHCLMQKEERDADGQHRLHRVRRLRDACPPESQSLRSRLAPRRTAAKLIVDAAGEARRCGCAWA